jgi:hypothetical protein
MPSNPDDRASTLKKIDEIEAQMSMQWWKTKHGDNSSRLGSSTNFPVSSHMPPDAIGRHSEPPASPTAYIRTEPAPLAAQSSGEERTEQTPLMESVTPRRMRAEPDDRTEAAPLEFTSEDFPEDELARQAPPPAPMAPPPMVQGPTMAQTPPPPPAPVPAPTASRQGPVSDSPASAFSSSKLFAIDVDEFAHDPELEEASIRFANGDDDGAEAGLLEVLRPLGTRVNHDETWLTLFDLYRATGQQDRFENAAIEFAGRFGRSAPQWFSMPEMLVGRMSGAGAGAGADRPAGHRRLDQPGHLRHAVAGRAQCWP